VERKKRKNRGEEGFTLVELLVVLAILAILVAIVTVNFTGLLGGAQTKAGAAEWEIVQTSVDVKMADLSWSAWTPVILPAAATSDMGAAGFDLVPKYMRDSTTKGTYSVDATGEVTQESTGY
jgi:prepilin-type N-terminal cleavage/methylation domain-containing protein